MTIETESSTVESMVVIDEEDGCDIGTATLKGPVPTVTVGGYYVWWLTLGIPFFVHRIYLGQWFIPLLMISSNLAATILLIVWASVLLFSTTSTAVMFPLAISIFYMLPLFTWMADGLRGCYFVEEYNETVDLSEMTTDEQREFLEVRRRIEKLDQRISSESAHKNE